jgi:thioredoxin reductase (NADPH)
MEAKKMSEQENILDILIIGAGPGGLTAAIYASRARRSTVVLDKVFPGGQLMYTATIENYPGIPGESSGMQLAANMVEQVKSFDVEIKMEEVKSIEREFRIFTVKTDKSEIKARSIIIGTGSSWKKLGAPGEVELTGRGVSYCGTCDAMLYRDKEIVVIGGGDTAIDEALFLSRFVKKLHVIHRRDELRAEKINQERAFANDKIFFIWDSVVTRIVGEKEVEAVDLLNKKTGEKSTFPTEGVFIFVGQDPNTKFVPEEIIKDEYGRLVTNLQMECNIPGIYAIGDVRSKSIRQVASAVGDGATAAWYADKYIDTLK